MWQTTEGSRGPIEWAERRRATPSSLPARKRARPQPPARARGRGAARTRRIPRGPRRDGEESTPSSPRRAEGARREHSPGRRAPPKANRVGATRPIENGPPTASLRAPPPRRDAPSAERNRREGRGPPARRSPGSHGTAGAREGAPPRAAGGRGVELSWPARRQREKGDGQERCQGQRPSGSEGGILVPEHDLVVSLRHVRSRQESVRGTERELFPVEAGTPVRFECPRDGKDRGGKRDVDLEAREVRAAFPHRHASASRRQERDPPAPPPDAQDPIPAKATHLDHAGGIGGLRRRSDDCHPEPAQARDLLLPPCAAPGVPPEAHRCGCRHAVHVVLPRVPDAESHARGGGRKVEAARPPRPYGAGRGVVPAVIVEAPWTGLLAHELNRARLAAVEVWGPRGARPGDTPSGVGEEQHAKNASDEQRVSPFFFEGGWGGRKSASAHEKRRGRHEERYPESGRHGRA